MQLLKALFENAELPADFKEKTTTLFEAAVDESVKAELVKIQESYDAKLVEAKAAFAADAVKTVDALVEETVLEWAKENAVALDSEIKGQIAESFLQGLKGVFEKADIELSGDTAGKELVKLQEANAALSAEAAATKQALVEAQGALSQIKRKEVIAQVTEGLADTQIHRVTKLLEAFDFKTEDDFRNKAALVVEAVGGKAIKGTHDADGVIVAVTGDTTPVATSKIDSASTGVENPEGVLVTKPAGAESGANGANASAEGADGKGAVVKDPVTEAYNHARDTYAPHFEADMVAETLKLFK
jgi:hypothetical protein